MLKRRKWEHKPCKNCDNNLDNCSIVYISYNDRMSYGALCDKCFYHPDVSVIDIIIHYTTRSIYEHENFSELEINVILDQIHHKLECDPLLIEKNRNYKLKLILEDEL